MERVTVETESKAYEVYIKAGLRHEIGVKLHSVLTEPASSIFIITDSDVAPHYLEDVKQSFLKNNENIPLYTEVIASGEASKSFSVYEQVLTKALSSNLDRQTVIIALGGGVVGDLAGFVAATYMRGVRFVQMPTTLLAHDSSVGGKVAINHALGKNMVGSFHQPEAVFYDTDTLYSLPEREWRSGFAEVMKHGFIRDVPFLSFLEKDVTSLSTMDKDVLATVLKRSIEIKANIVSEDERESGVRAHLNFGHTLAHALETELGYGEITHGEAVVIGMVFALHVSEHLFQVDLRVSHFQSWFESLGYDVAIPSHVQVESLINTMKKDKKAKAGIIRMVVLRAIGEATVVEVDSNTLFRLLENKMGVGARG